MFEWISLSQRQDYAQNIVLVQDTVCDIIKGGAFETIYLLEYHDVYTGGSATPLEDKLKTSINNIPIIYDVGRGGKLTYHGPGQRIIYPLLNLASAFFNKDIRYYVRFLEKWIIETLSYFDIQSFSDPKNIGIWVMLDKKTQKKAKIASIGIRVKKWISYHGIAINISTDLKNFAYITPCGIKDCPITSMHALGKEITFAEFDYVLKTTFYNMYKS